MENFLQRLIQVHCRQLYALYDSAQDESLGKELPHLDVMYSCLYEGLKAQTLRRVAPYMIECKNFENNSEKFLGTFWGRGVSMLVQSNSTFEAVRHQLRRNAFVKNSQGVECYFRYYDSRAFGQFFEIANQGQMDNFFGTHIQAIHWHDKKMNRMLTLTKSSKNFLDKMTTQNFTEFEFVQHI
jgi:Domain of unknown function (DUF4123)